MSDPVRRAVGKPSAAAIPGVGAAARTGVVAGGGDVVARGGDVPVMNIANVLTVFRIVLVPVFVVVLFIDNGESTWWRVAAWVVFAVAAVTDQLDGRLARKYGLVTDFGKMADPIADKALIGAALISLSILDVMPWWITAVILGREIGVTVLRFAVLRYGVIPASRGGKLKTLLQAVAIGLYILPLGGAWQTGAEVIMLIAVAVTVVTGLDYVWRAIVLRRQALGAAGE